MPIRLAGLSSNMDTDAMVKALVSSYSYAKDNMVKAQTKLLWRQDSWKAMNTKIYGFYTKSLSNMRLSSTYTLKTASISDTTLAKVTSSSLGVDGSQSLIVKTLASSGYLTGGKISSTSGGTITSSTKLKDITSLSGLTNGVITAGVDGKSTDINITSDMSVSEFVVKLKEAGLNANFDETNQRFFINSKNSGAEGDFTLTAGDAAGLSAMQALKIFTVQQKDTDEYTKWANYTDDEIADLKTAQYEATKTNDSAVTQEYESKYKTAKDSIASLNAQNEQYNKEISRLQDEKSNALLTEDDKAKIDEQIAGIQTKIDNNATTITKNQTDMNDAQPYIVLDTDNEEEKTQKQKNIQDEVDRRNVEIKSKANQLIDNKVAAAKVAVGIPSDPSSGAVRIVGADAKIVLNNVEFTSKTNNFSINGLTIQALSLSKTDDPATITTGSDIDGIYNMIKSFLKDYNTLMGDMNTSYNATSSKGYEPLTSDEKEKMTDTQIKEWETKIKDSLLRKDSDLGAVINSLNSSMLSSFKIGDKSINLASFGIGTPNYFATPVNGRGQYHIDGDSDDSYSSGKVDKLRAAIANNPEGVIDFFTKLASKVYDDLKSKMSSTTLRSSFTVYNDKQMATEYSSYTTKIKAQETKVSDMEQYYYNKFTRMEQALSKLNSNTSSLSKLFQ